MSKEELLELTGEVIEKTSECHVPGSVRKRG